MAVMENSVRENVNPNCILVVTVAKQLIASLLGKKKVPEMGNNGDCPHICRPTTYAVPLEDA